MSWGKWIRVVDRVPEDGSGNVLVLTDRGAGSRYRYHRVIAWRDSGKWRGIDHLQGPITHWIPLPEPPEEVCAMNCEANFVCITCRKVYYCGYGSYGRLQERLAKAPQTEHAGHETSFFTEDFTYIDTDGDLRRLPNVAGWRSWRNHCKSWECQCIKFIIGDEKWLIGYVNYDKIDLSDKLYERSSRVPDSTASPAAD